mmetsp:Transcript_54617/g.128238  ORF Transcript_54617/g.128238 Transcript_54617/m.128238 type:complete len:409 (+) Transcript_54617:42-1268(+)
MSRAKAAAVVAAITGHAHNQTSTLKVLHYIDLVIRLHACEDYTPGPKLLKQLRVGCVEVSPGCTRQRQLAVWIWAVRSDTTLLVLGICPHQPTVHDCAAKTGMRHHDSAGPADGDAGKLVVACADHGADRAFFEALDGFGGVCLHLISEQEQSTDVDEGLELLTRRVADLLVSHRWQLLVGDAEGVVVVLGTLHGHLVVVRRHRRRLSKGLDLLVAALDEDLQFPGCISCHRTASHAVVVELELTNNFQDLALGGDHLLHAQLPAHRANHGTFDLISDQSPGGAQLLHGVADSQGPAKHRRHLHLVVYFGTVLDALGVAVIEVHTSVKPPGRSTHNSSEVHSCFGDRSGLVEHHGGDLPGNGDPSRLKALDLILALLVIEAPRRHGLPHDHGHGHHRIQRHCHGAKNR